MLEQKVVMSSVLRNYRVLSNTAESDLELTAVLRPAKANFRVLSTIEGMGDIVRIWEGSQPRVIVSGPDTCQALLSSNKELNKGAAYKFIESWLGKGLLLSDGDSHWHGRRKLLTKAFHFRILNNFVHVFNRQGSKFVDKLRDKVDGEAFNIIPLLARCSLDIIFETAMGRSINAQDSDSSIYVRTIKKLVSILDERLRKVWLHPDLLFRLLGPKKEYDACVKLLHQLSLETIRERRRTYLEEAKARENQKVTEEDVLLGKGKKQLALLDLLLEASEEGNNLTDDEIIEEVNTFMIAGHDTTASGMSWFLYLMGRNPHIQARVQEELDSIFGDSDRPASMEDLALMKYTENCIKETLRLFPPVPRFGRKLSDDFMIGQRFAMLEQKVVLSNTAESDLELTAEAVLRPAKGNYIKLLPRLS